MRADSRIRWVSLLLCHTRHGVTSRPRCLEERFAAFVLPGWLLQAMAAALRWQEGFFHLLGRRPLVS